MDLIQNEYLTDEVLDDTSLSPDPDDDDNEDEDFDRDAFDRGLEGDEDILFPSKSNEEGIKEYDKRQAEKADEDDN